MAQGDKSVIPEKIPIYNGKLSENILFFANYGHGMSEKCWDETMKIHEQGLLWGVWKTQSGKLKRELKG